MRFLDRLRFHRNIFEIPEAPLKGRLRFGPKQLHDLHRFSEARHSFLTRIAEDLLVRSQMASPEADAENRPATTHAIQGRKTLGQLNRIAQSQ